MAVCSNFWQFLESEESTKSSFSKFNQISLIRGSFESSEREKSNGTNRGAVYTTAQVLCSTVASYLYQQSEFSGIITM